MRGGVQGKQGVKISGAAVTSLVHNRTKGKTSVAVTVQTLWLPIDIGHRAIQSGPLTWAVETAVP